MNEDPLSSLPLIQPNKVLVTKYDHNAVKKGWMDIPSKDDLKPGEDGKYRCPSPECHKKPPFKTYTSTCRHIQIEHQGYRYRCDLCREEYQTEVEFRSHSTLKIHLQNMHKLAKADFSRIRIVLSLVGNDSIVKKTASSDDEEFNKWRKNIIDNDTKRNGKGKKKLLHVTKKSRSILKKLPVFGLAATNVATEDDDDDIKPKLEQNGIKHESSSTPSATGSSIASSSMDVKFGVGEAMDVDMDLNVDTKGMISNLNGNTHSVTQAAMTVNNKKDKAFMDRIDQLISNLETDPKKKRRNHGKEPVCDICNERFKNFQALGGHKKKHNPEWKKSVRQRMSKKKKGTTNDHEMEVESDSVEEDETEQETDDEDIDIKQEKNKNKKRKSKRIKHENDVDDGSEDESDSDSDDDNDGDGDGKVKDEKDVKVKTEKNKNKKKVKFDMRGLPHIDVSNRIRPPPPPPKVYGIADLKMEPFGPMFGIVGNGVNMFEECKNKTWVKDMKSEISVKFGSTIMHLNDS